MAIVRRSGLERFLFEVDTTDGAMAAVNVLGRWEQEARYARRLNDSLVPTEYYEAANPSEPDLAFIRSKVEEWTWVLASRDCVDVTIDRFGADLTPTLISWRAQVDRIFDEATIEDRQVAGLWGATESLDWWWRRVPRGGHLRAAIDAQARTSES